MSDRTFVQSIRRGFVENVGIPIAAGLIVGEALVGVGKAMAAVLAGAGGG